MSIAPVAPVQQREKTAQFLWTGFILLFFLIQAVIWTVAITFTASDKSHAVVPGYDARALNWDDEVEMRRASDRLEWTVNLMVDTKGDIRGVRPLTIQLTDKNEVPISGANLEITAFHQAMAGVPQEISMSEINKGVYSGNITIRKSGQWRFEGRATIGDSVFLVDERQQLKVSR